MSTATKKPPAAGSGSGTGVPRRPGDPNYSPGASGRGIGSGSGTTRSPTPSSSPSTNANGSLARTRSLRGGAPVSARAAALQRSGGPGSSNLSTNSSASEADDDARAETVALLDDLKERLRQTEIKSEQFQKQAEVLQARLDEALMQQGKLEDKVHESEERIEVLNNEKREISRQMREMETIYEAERSSMTREREDMANREEDMQAVIQRLKDTLAQRSSGEDDVRVSRQSNNSSPSIDNGHFAPPSALHRSDSRNNSKLLLQKDRLIESLRLELAEAQIKLVETENMGGGRLQEVERLLMEARMTNARLMEDNESYQLLLSEKTLNGDFTKDNLGYMTSAANAEALEALEGRKGVSSLADELSEAAEGESENYRRLEIELKSARDQNKALTLYINKIIERLLQHQDFESILDQSSDFKPPSGGSANVDKDLPPPPPPKESSYTGSMLQRAKSVISTSSKPRPRPMSQMPAAHSALTDPDTAPSIPIGLGRSSSVRQGGARPRSEQFTTGGNAANIVNSMYKGPPGPTSPTHGPQTPRTSQSFFAPPPAGGNPNAAARQPSGTYPPSNSGGPPGSTGTFPGGRTSETSSTASGDSNSVGGDVTTPPSGNSPPREREKEKATFAGNKPRPLQLVQSQNEASKGDATKASKRESWMGWALGKKEELFPSAAAGSGEGGKE